jgi:hypothetical protein
MPTSKWARLTHFHQRSRIGYAYFFPTLRCKKWEHILTSQHARFANFSQRCETKDAHFPPPYIITRIAEVGKSCPFCEVSILSSHFLKMTQKICKIFNRMPIFEYLAILTHLYRHLAWQIWMIPTPAPICCQICIFHIIWNICFIYQ